MAKKTQTNKTLNLFDFSELCKGTYTRQTFKDVWIKPIFGDLFNDLGFQNGQDYLAFSEVNESHASNLGIKQCILLGTADCSGEQLLIFEIKLKNNIQLARNRVGVQAFIREVFDRTRRTQEIDGNTTIPTFGLLMAFYQEPEDAYSDNKKAKNRKVTSDEWRLSLCIQNNGQYTTARRYTYVFGPNKPCYTPNKQFKALCQNHGKLTLKNVIDAFSVEAVTKEFYKGQDGVPKGDKDDKTTPEEWLEKYYAKCTDKFGYYQWYQVFQSYVILHSEDRDKFGAYFSMADKPADEKDKKQREIRDYVKKLFGRIVFLFFLQKKGWLGCDANDTEWKTGNQRFMQELLEAYTKNPEKYRYTDTEENVDRSGFLDAMLEPLFFKNLNHERTNDLFERDGKVFKVDGMGKCKIPYLNGGLFSKDPVDPPVSRFPDEFFTGFFGFLDKYNFTIYENDPMDVEVSVDPEMLGKIFEGLLEDNKDKGAFYTPKEIVHYMCKESLIAYLNKDKDNEYTEAALRHLIEYHDLCGEASSLDTPKNKKALLAKLIAVKICDPAIGSGAFPMGLLLQLLHCRQALGDETDLGEMKRSIIQNNIYGVDIDRGAIDIARLRFWLSLVVDAQKPEPLPNLNYKIMQGNSLLESYHKYDLSRLSEGIIQTGKQGVLSSSLTNQLLAAKDDYFSATQHDTREALNEGIIRCCKALVEMANLEESARAELSTLIPKENDEFFLWHLWFKDVFDQGGFDIVIGNPPYALTEKANISDRIQEQYKKYSVHEYKIQLYALFYELSSKLLNLNSIIHLLTPNTYYRDKFKFKLRKFILDNFSLISFMEFGKAFETANIYVSSLLAISKPKEEETKIKSYTYNFNTDEYYCNYETLQINYITSDYMQFTKPVIINLKETDKLGDVCEIYLGIQIKNRNKSYDESKYHDGWVKMINGEDIQKYYTAPSKAWFCFKKQFCKSGYDDNVYKRTTVVIPQCKNTIVASIRTSGILLSNTAFSIYSVRYANIYNEWLLMAFLNSRLVYWYWTTYLAEEKVLFSKLNKHQLQQIPIPTLASINKNNDKCMEIEKISKEIFEIRNHLSVSKSYESNLNKCEKLKKLDDAINKLIFDLYNITENECNLINKFYTDTFNLNDDKNIDSAQTINKGA